MKSTKTFPGRVGFQQRVLPAYRQPFFDALAAACERGLSVFAGNPRPSEAIVTARDLQVAGWTRSHNLHLLRGPAYMCWQKGVGAWLDDWSPDVLVLGADPRVLSSHAAARWARRRGVPVIGFGIGLLANRDRRVSPVRSFLRGRLFRRFDGAIAYGSRAAEEFVASGIPADRVFIAQNASPPPSPAAATLRRDSPEVARWRAELGLKRPTVVALGRLIPGKRVDLLIEACASLGDRCDLVIAGDGPERRNLEARAAESFPRARFLGHVEGHRLSVALAGSDVFVLPGLGGLAIHEAMAHGLPVVATVGDGTEADLVQEGRNGTIVEAGDAGALAGAIAHYADDPVAAAAAGEESRKIATEEFTVEKMVESCVEAFKAVRNAR